MCYLIKTFSGLEGGTETGREGIFLPQIHYLRFDLSAAQTDVRKNKRGPSQKQESTYLFP